MTNVPVPPVEPKKGMSPLLWVAVGCLGLLVLGGIVATAAGVFLFGKARQVAREMQDDPIATTAKFLAAANPDIELVEANKDERTVTFRDTKTGKDFTFGYDDIEAGRVTFSSGEEEAELEFATEGEDEDAAAQLTIRSGEGTTTFRSGAKVEDLPDWVPVYPGVSPEGNFSSETPEVRAGSFRFETQNNLDEVLDFYASAVERSGLSVSSRNTSNDGGLLIAASSDEARSLNVLASQKADATEVVVNFNEKR